MNHPPRTLAIGDVHGCAAALEALLRAVAPTPDDLLVFLGDYVDRGPDSAAVLDRLVRLSETHNLVALRGNHEQLMTSARHGEADRALWHSLGGEATLDSYSPFYADHGSLADVPDEHWSFLDRLVDCYETDTHFFVHGGAAPHLPLAKQSPLVLRWQTFNDPPPHPCGKIMVCGHTPQTSGLPRHLGHAVCIDTHCHAGGWLTCLDVRSGAVWQSNQKSETRRAHLDDFRA